MKLFFSDNKYKESAYRILHDSQEKELISMEDAFLVLIKDLPKEQLDILCKEISSNLNINEDDAYSLTQQIDNNNHSKEILNCAYKLIKNNIYFGSEKTEDNRFNKSSWLSHSFNNAIVCYNLAKALNLNCNTAFTYGLLHDYGRKYSHTFDHVIKGFEKLIDLGLENEAKACITHSFINSGRYSNNEVPEDDFVYDGKKEIANNNSDEIVYVLNGSIYTPYDDILNIADLMATSYGIVSPLDRINDIASRRPNIDNAPNRKYFLLSYCNLLKKTISKMGIDLNIQEPNQNDDLNTIKDYFERVSNIFYENYIHHSSDIEIIKKGKLI